MSVINSSAVRESGEAAALRLPSTPGSGSISHSSMTGPRRWAFKQCTQHGLLLSTAVMVWEGPTPSTPTCRALQVPKGGTVPKGTGRAGGMVAPGAAHSLAIGQCPSAQHSPSGAVLLPI